MYVPLRKAKAHFGVCGNTLRKWADEGQIETIRNPAGQRLFNLASLNKQNRRNVCYCRVSGRAQKDDLERQIKYMRQQFPDYEIIKDFGSGLNWKRKGFATLLDKIMQNEIGRVVVAHKDRLCRFGFELVERIAAKHGCELVVLDETRLSPEQELVADLISIIHVFSCRLYGLRKYATKVSKDTSLSRRRKQKKS